MKPVDDKYSRESTKDPVALAQQFGSEPKDLSRYRVTVYPSCVVIERNGYERLLMIESDSLNCSEGSLESASQR